MNRLDHVVPDNLKNYKYQSNEAIRSHLEFDTSGFNLSSGTSEPLPLVTVYLQLGKENIATTVAGLASLWKIGATDSMIKI